LQLVKPGHNFEDLGRPVGDLKRRGVEGVGRGAAVVASRPFLSSPPLPRRPSRQCAPSRPACARRAGRGRTRMRRRRGGGTEAGPPSAVPGAPRCGARRPKTLGGEERTAGPGPARRECASGRGASATSLSPSGATPAMHAAA
jgi:hypothetical protein